jgi:hypothetical protein
MPNELPATVKALIAARDEAGRVAAWSDFLDEFGDLILHVARTMGVSGAKSAGLPTQNGISLDQRNAVDVKQLGMGNGRSAVRFPPAAASKNHNKRQSVAESEHRQAWVPTYAYIVIE